MAKFLSLILLGLASVSQAKDHFQIVEDTSPDDEAYVQAVTTKKLCAFEYTSSSSDTDQLCIEYQGESTVGFDWAISSQEANTNLKQGYFKLAQSFYVKLDMLAKPIFELHRLFKNNIDIDLDEFKVHHTTQVFYDYYTNDLCFDIYSQIDDIKITLTQNFAFLECYKILIECLNDCGQFSEDDKSTTEKPISPFAKIFDECSLSNDASFVLKEFDIFTMFPDFLHTIKWLGQGPTAYTQSAYYPNCFPGNIVRAIYLMERKAASAVGLPAGMTDEEAYLSDEHPSLVKTFVKPFVDYYVVKFLTFLADMANDFEPNSEDGTRIIYSGEL